MTAKRDALWIALRPQRIEDFLGYQPVLLQLSGIRTGLVLFHGPVGCGKTSAARALGHSIVGKPIPEPSPDGSVAVFGDNNTWGLQVRGRKFREALLHRTALTGDGFVIVDEAHRLSENNQEAIQVFIERRGAPLVCLCTSEINGLSDALKSRCTYKIKLGPLKGADREELVKRGWAFRQQPGRPDQLIAELTRIATDDAGKDEGIAARDILQAVDRHADGLSARDAIRS